MAVINNPQSKKEIVEKLSEIFPELKNIKYFTNILIDISIHEAIKISVDFHPEKQENGE